ncbi:histidine kinase [Alteromonas sp. ASW11-36]|uniref:Histidine kinase n=1 Tax=Alteromonas arenosi TaxID=3055817 RepID=A0ABT7T0C5_9ALTE|nr:histidine kinase [Alteromonas sp. ASW11-36]MDM7861855.1 histidine kinase [Alteromonas sp. ASW11-36]
MKFLERLQRIELEVLSALVTWLLVSASAVYLMWQSHSYSTAQTLLAGALYLLFWVFWHAATREREYRHEPTTRLVLFALQWLIIIGLYFSVPYTYTAILAVMMCSILPYVMPFKFAVVLSLVVSLPLWLVYQYYWQREGMLITATLFWTFNLFALVMINSMIKAKQAHTELSIANRELIATQSLLTEATKQSERTRIARNIHDLLGHHLTALTIKLQVASRISDGESKRHIDECYGLAKLLLSDVREAVSEIREKSHIDLHAAFTALQKNTPQLNVYIEIPTEINIDNVQCAEVLLRCVQESITNTLKHSDAQQINVTLEQQQDDLTLEISDNGVNQKSALTLGNGLNGMTERVQALGGKVVFNRDEHGFHTQIIIGTTA